MTLDPSLDRRQGSRRAATRLRGKESVGSMSDDQGGCESKTMRYSSCNVPTLVRARAHLVPIWVGSARIQASPHGTDGWRAQCEQDRRERDEFEAMIRQVKDLEEWHAPADLRVATLNPPKTLDPLS
eukprot:2663599-Rhodomonas_salina.4